MAELAETHSIYVLDQELELLTEAMEDASESGAIPNELRERFCTFCEAFGEKVDRIGRFLRMQEAKADFARKEAQRLFDRVRSAENRIRGTKEMLLYFMGVRAISKIEGRTFTLRVQNNSQDTLKVENVEALSMSFRKVRLTVNGILFSQLLKGLARDRQDALLGCVEEYFPNNDALHAALDRGEDVPGVRRYRGKHIRIA
jgi:hypothetical protein